MQVSESHSTFFMDLMLMTGRAQNQPLSTKMVERKCPVYRFLPPFVRCDGILMHRCSLCFVYVLSIAFLLV